MGLSNNKGKLMRGSKNLDQAVKDLMRTKKLTKKEAADIVAYEFNQLLKKKDRMKKIDFELRFF